LESLGIGVKLNNPVEDGDVDKAVNTDLEKILFENDVHEL
jgi:hypothetical protein